MSVPKPLNWNATLVLQALARGHGYGFEIMGATELPSGTVYPVLRRLEAAALVSTPDWVDGVWVGGRQIVEDGHHPKQGAIRAAARSWL